MSIFSSVVGHSKLYYVLWFIYYYFLIPNPWYTVVLIHWIFLTNLITLITMMPTAIPCCVILILVFDHHGWNKKQLLFYYYYFYISVWNFCLCVVLSYYSSFFEIVFTAFYRHACVHDKHKIGNKRLLFVQKNNKYSIPQKVFKTILQRLGLLLNIRLDWLGHFYFRSSLQLKCWCDQSALYHWLY